MTPTCQTDTTGNAGAFLHVACLFGCGSRGTLTSSVFPTCRTDVETSTSTHKTMSVDVRVYLQTK